MSVDEEIDIILPRKDYDFNDVYEKVRSIDGMMWQQRVRFRHLTDRYLDNMLAIDSRFGGVDRRLDKLEQCMEGIEAKLDRLLEVLDDRDGERS